MIVKVPVSQFILLHNNIHSQNVNMKPSIYVLGSSHYQ